ncbi:MAG: hypothetical protein OHK0022_31560 [Roseiflexaceae bacterium]
MPKTRLHRGAGLPVERLAWGAQHLVDDRRGKALGRAGRHALKHSLVLLPALGALACTVAVLPAGTGALEHRRSGLLGLRGRGGL